MDNNELLKKRYKKALILNTLLIFLFSFWDDLYSPISLKPPVVHLCNVLISTIVIITLRKKIEEAVWVFFILTITGLFFEGYYAYLVSMNSMSPSNYLYLYFYLPGFGYYSYKVLKLCKVKFKVNLPFIIYTMISTGCLLFSLFALKAKF